MKTLFPTMRFRAAMGVLAVLISVSLTGEAKAQKIARVAPAAKAEVMTIPNDSAEAGMLRQAYGILSVADHDYKGHRAKAMKEIEVAAKHLGVNLRGDGKGHEAQGTSDAQLRTAAGLLQQASGGLRGPGLEHIKLAYAQLDTALRIR